MGERTGVRKGYNAGNKGYHDNFARRRRLGFGHWWGWPTKPRAFGCVSRSSGLTCWNRVGHGWWLGRYRGYRVF